MTKAEKVNHILSILDQRYPNPHIPLNHHDAYTLLVAVVLSAQCTDKMVNKITPILFDKANTPQAMMTLTVQKIEEIIRPCGLSSTKAKGIAGLSEIITKKYNGDVPGTFEALESLPSVGHKTASVVMTQWFEKAAFPVDTHIHRLAHRWGLSTGKNVVQTEKDLKRLIPSKKWNTAHLQFIYFGREHCPSKGHKWKKCPICSLYMMKKLRDNT